MPNLSFDIESVSPRPEQERSGEMQPSHNRPSARNGGVSTYMYDPEMWGAVIRDPLLAGHVVDHRSILAHDEVQTVREPQVPTYDPQSDGGFAQWLEERQRAEPRERLDEQEGLRELEAALRERARVAERAREHEALGLDSSIGDLINNATRSPFETQPPEFRRTRQPYTNPYGMRRASGDSSQGTTNNVSRNGSISGNVEVNNNMKIAQIYGQRATYPTIQGHPLIVGTNLAGIEIELEEIHLGDEPTFQYWEAKQDGSLRNSGMEFVCSSPWGGRDLYAASLEIDSFLFRHSPDASWRCSTHVHIDVRDLTVPQLKRLILAYIVYERVLFRCSGWQRYKNNFCVALGFAQEQLATLSENWHRDDAEFTNRVIRDWDKYTSLNLLPISSFGSVEFRISEAKWRKGSIIRLTNRFLSLKELAVGFEGNDGEFIEHLMSIPMHHAIRKGLPKVVPNFEEDMDIGYKLAYEVISMSQLRRLGAHVHEVPINDGSHRTEFHIDQHYWNHLVTNVETRSNGTWLLPRDRPTILTFKWLAELRFKCEDMGVTFDIDWFMYPTNQSQRQRLFREFYRNFCSQDNSESPEAPQPIPAMPRQADYEIYTEDDDVEEDDEHNDYIA